MVELYRKRPITVEAIHCTFFNKDEWWSDLERMCDEVGLKAEYTVGNYSFSCISPRIKFTDKNTSGTLHILEPIYDGDYFVKGVDGSVYPVKKDTFEKIYDKIDEDRNTITW